MNACVHSQLDSCLSSQYHFSSVIKNIAHLCSRTRSKTWGPNGWQKVVVCVVSDGRSKVNKRTLHVLSLVSCARCFLRFETEWLVDGMLPGRCSQGHGRGQGRNRPYFRVSQPAAVRRYVLTNFRYTTNVIVTDSGEVSMGTTPVQVSAIAAKCLQLAAQLPYRSYSVSRSRTRRSSTVTAGSSMRSVLWSSPTVSAPECDMRASFLHNDAVCILLDVGTKPTGTSIYELWKCMCLMVSIVGHC
jgi:chitin synthase